MPPVLRDRHDVVAVRLAGQRLIGKAFRRVEEVVAWHLAMQSQDFGGAKWAIGQRLVRATDASVEAAFDQGKLLRTHVLRPTWHFVAPADVRWLQQLTAPRVRALSAPYFRKFGLDARVLGRSRRVLEKNLRDGRFATRDELALRLAEAGLPAKGEALTYQMMAAELDAVIVSGPRRGKQHTYALLEERVPRTEAKSRDEALAELSYRYLQSHGPALPQDLAWWSGLTIADAKRGILANASRLENTQVDDKTFWLVPGQRRARPTPPLVHLLPNYDEQLIAYRERGCSRDERLSRAPRGAFDAHFVLVNGLLVGGWRRELGPTKVRVLVRTQRRLSITEQRALNEAARRYASFLQLGLELSVRQRERGVTR
jgi:hypothetical protein